MIFLDSNHFELDGLYLVALKTNRLQLQTDVMKINDIIYLSVNLNKFKPVDILRRKQQTSYNLKKTADIE